MEERKFQVGDKVRRPGLSTSYKVGQKPFIVEGYLYDRASDMEFVVDKYGQEHAETNLELVPDWEYELTNDSASDFRDSLEEVLGRVRSVLIQKNHAYGNSALDPVRVFSKASPTEQLRVRIDDKISRLQRGGEDTEDTVLDLIGYLILLKIAEGE